MVIEKPPFGFAIIPDKHPGCNLRFIDPDRKMGKAGESRTVPAVFRFCA